MFANDEQPRKASSPMLVTPSGIMYDVASCRMNAIIRSLALLNITPSSYMIYGDLFVNFPFQPLNEPPVNPFTEAGIVMLANASHFSKTRRLINDTLSGIVMFVNDLQLLKASSHICFRQLERVMLTNDSQDAKALFPIPVTPPRIMMFVNDVQFAKASSPIYVTLSGISMLASDSQFWNASSQIRFRL